VSATLGGGVNDGHLDAVERPLRERRERAHLLDLVAEELDPERLAAGRREHVDEVAANRELAALLHPVDSLVAGERELLDQRLEPPLLAGSDCDRRGASPRRRHALGERRRRDDDEPAALQDVQRPRPLTDEVRRRREAGVPAHAATRQQCNPLLAEVPRGCLGDVARVGVLRDEERQSAAELLVQRGEDERQHRLGHAGTSRQRLGELLEPLAPEELAHEREEDWALFDIPDHHVRRGAGLAGRNLAAPGGS
jgi:hypothetical protein